MKLSSQQEIIEGIASVIPVLFLAGLIGVIVMAVRKIKKVADKVADKVVPIGWKVGEKKPRPNIFKILFKQWQFWLIFVIFVAVIVLAAINSGDDGVITAEQEVPQVQVQEAMVKNVVSYVNVIVLLAVVGFIVSIFIRLSKSFR